MARITPGDNVIRLDWYVGKSVLVATLLAWAAIVALDAVLVFLGELGDMDRGSYSPVDALLYVGLTLPGRAYPLFPMAALIGCLLGLGNLAAQREITAFRLSGCSPLRLMRAVLQAGVLMSLVALALGEWLAPNAWRLGTQLRTTALYADVGVQRGEEFWVRDGRRLTRIGRSEADGSLTDLTLFELAPSPRLLSATAVAMARYRDDRWWLEDVRTSTFSQARIDLAVSLHSTSASLIDPGLARLLSRDARTLNLVELQRYIGYLQDNGSNDAPWRLHFWQRLAAPVAALAMLVLSVGLVLGPSGGKGVGQRVLVGVLIGLAFKLLNDISAYAGLVYGFPPGLNAFLPSLLVFVPALLLMWRFA